jgi:hypothetical protein
MSVWTRKGTELDVNRINNNINHEFNNLINMIMNVKLIIELFSLEFNLIIILNSLLRIRLNLFIIVSNEFTFFRRFIKGFQ